MLLLSSSSSFPYLPACKCNALSLSLSLLCISNYMLPGFRVLLSVGFSFPELSRVCGFNYIYIYMFCLLKAVSILLPVYDNLRQNLYTDQLLILHVIACVNDISNETRNPSASITFDPYFIFIGYAVRHCHSTYPSYFSITSNITHSDIYILI